MKALLIKIYQPTAHYRIPFAYQRRHTYPIPPYSTAIGFICNMLGIDHQGNKQYEQLIKCKLSISGRFEQKLTEYIWFRNLSVVAHNNYFLSKKATSYPKDFYAPREKNGEINHIGGQSPMRIDVLENMHLNIHIAGNEDFLSELETYLHNPVNRLETVHLGRAEDWLVFESIQLIELKKSIRDKNYNHFFWIPQYLDTTNEIAFNFDKAEGLLYNLPVFSTIKNYEKTYDRNAERSFTYMRSKLNDGAIMGMEYWYDDQSGVPVFLADLNRCNFQDPTGFRNLV